jgi:hypothetical protein
MVMIKDVVFPWNADTDLPETVWASGCLTTREFGRNARKEIFGRDLERATKIADGLVKHNLWTVCLSSSPYYMRTLYPAIAAAWMYSRRDTADIIDAETLVKGAFSFDANEKEEFKNVILGTGLLIIPYIDPSYMGINKVRGLLSGLLMNRKLQNRPVLVDVKPSRRPGSAAEAARELSQLQDVFGESVLSLFKGSNTKFFIISNT